MQIKAPLKYRITDWRQLVDVKSNNSRALSISVTDFIQDKRLTGFRIQVNHTEFGVLFACVLQAQGSMVAFLSDNILVEFTPIQILAELEKFGFLVVYEPHRNLPSNQLMYLMKIRELGFDKIRVLNVHKTINGVPHFTWYVVVFNITQNPDWLNNGYSPSEREFFDALQNGSAINISAQQDSKRFNWSWLAGWVGDIGDILEQNA